MVADQNLKHYNKEGAAEGRGECQAPVIPSLAAACISGEPWRAKILKGSDKLLNILCNCLVQSSERMTLSRLPPLQPKH